jgi:hypothetical protein
VLFWFFFHQPKQVMKFYGSSDDLIYVVDEDGNKEEYYPSTSGDDLKSVFTVGPFYVFVYYDGIWHFSVRIQKEGDSVPEDVSVQIGQYHEYSMELEIVSDQRPLNAIPVDIDQVSF